MTIDSLSQLASSGLPSLGGSYENPSWKRSLGELKASGDSLWTHHHHHHHQNSSASRNSFGLGNGNAAAYGGSPSGATNPATSSSLAFANTTAAGAAVGGMGTALLGTKKRWIRRQINVRDPGGLKTGIRLVIYRRWLGRRGWNRRWHGHIFVKAKKKMRFRCPRKRFCHRLKRDVRQMMRARPKKLSPRAPRFAWRLRRALERYKGYEVEVQTR